MTHSPHSPQASTITLVAPFDGVAMPLQSVRDPVFAGLVMGDGLAIEPTSSILLAPCNGTVTHLAKTFHAISLRADNGAELLLHIGIDTVQLKGQGFAALVALGDTVRAGQPLIEFDADYVARSAACLQTTVIVTSEGFTLGGRASGVVEAGVSPFLCLSALAATVPGGTEGLVGTEVRLTATVHHGGGLHARPAALVNASVRDLAAEVSIEVAGRRANARSVTALMGLGLNQWDSVFVCARGADARAAAEAAVNALQTASQAHVTVQDAVPMDLPGDGPAWRGVRAAGGIAVGTAVRLDAARVHVPEHASGIDPEFEVLASALGQVREHMTQAVQDARHRKAHAEVAIFTAHLSLLDDPELIGDIERGVLRGQTAGYSLRQAVAAQCKILLNLGNPVLAERVADMRDIERQLLAALGYMLLGTPEVPDRAIIVADDLTPSELTQLPRDRLVGFATAKGGSTSHVAILARAMGLPLLVAVGPRLLQVETGQKLLLDADDGWILAEPGAAELARAGDRIFQAQQRREQSRLSAALPAHTLDKVMIEVAANIANEGDAHEAVANGADGVGLLRTEFLFESRTEMPTVAEQLQLYQEVLDAMGERKVIIRTMDVGGDKEVPYMKLPHEDNPALGMRGIRMGLEQPEILDAQLRALLSVRPLHRLRILVPMITEVSEVVRVRERIDALVAELDLAERPELGVMIEVPSAALVADQLARYVDFFSIGTNDLTQYTLAMDRCHPGLASRVDPLHPSILRLIAMAVDGARQHGKWVGMCGGMASDLEAVPVLVGLGVTELSVSPPLVPEVKAVVRGLLRDQCQEAVTKLLNLESASAVRLAARKLWPQRVG